MNLQRLWWGLGALLVVVATLLCLVPVPQMPGEFSLNDKFAHIIGHAGLAAWFAGLLPRRSWWKIFVFLLAFGAAIECVQYVMQVGRDGDPRDVLANLVGALSGLVLGRLGLARWPELAARMLGQRIAQ